eukprot:GHVU01184192.1.p1 GENE.GHVU01184192.1~~GHVU01184192.1.p1  ORF type:complete len:168 (+),score=23.91 GHVU01184192.1:717-1220(+)
MTSDSELEFDNIDFVVHGDEFVVRSVEGDVRGVSASRMDVLERLTAGLSAKGGSFYFCVGVETSRQRHLKKEEKEGGKTGFAVQELMKHVGERQRVAVGMPRAINREHEEAEIRYSEVDGGTHHLAVYTSKSVHKTDLLTLFFADGLPTGAIYFGTFNVIGGQKPGR